MRQISQASKKIERAVAQYDELHLLIRGSRSKQHALLQVLPLSGNQHSNKEQQVVRRMR